MKKINIFTSDWDEIFYSGKNNFSNYAFPLYLFTTRLYNSLVEKGSKDVLFMSREGQFLKTLFDKYLLMRRESGIETIPIRTHYFYGSRNSIMTASMGPLETETFEHFFRFFRFFMSAKMFLYSIGFTEEQIQLVRENFGKATDKICFNFSTSRIFKRLKQNNVFRCIYDDIRTAQAKAFSAYMESFELDFIKDGVVFVDIGYHGTMQDLIFKFFDGKVNITGYFIKCRAKSSENNQKIGLLSDNNNRFLGTKITKHNSFNYEQILRADHGRCVGYDFLDSKRAGPVLDKKFNAKEIFDKFVSPIQNEILVKFERIARLSRCEENGRVCTIYYYYMVKNKSKIDYNWLLNMQDCHHDDFGYVGYPGKAFVRWLRRVVFTIKDKKFVILNKHYINKLRKAINI